MQVYTESPLVLRESLGSSHNRLTSAEDYARGFTFGLSARRSFGREECVPCRRERQSLTPLALPQYLGALAEHSGDHQFRCGCRGPWRNLFAGDELSFTQKLT